MKIIRNILITLAALALVAGGVWLLTRSGHKDHAAAKSGQLYTCGMHPQIIQDKPGNCPVCHMKLTPIRNASDGNATGGSTITIDPVTIQNMNIRTTTVARGPLRRVIRTVGTIEYRETGLADVSTKFKGWIEKLHVDTTGQQVHRGDLLFEIYSPELYSAQVEYLLTTQAADAAGPDGQAMRKNARTKLKFYDISDDQIAKLEKTGQPNKTLEIHAPINGFVIRKKVVEGQMIEIGEQIYRLADLSLVWVYGQIYEQDLPHVRLGQEATVTLASLPDRQFRGRVTYIYPEVDRKTRTARVRMEFHNPGYFLKPGMFAKVLLTSELTPSTLLVPDSAVLRSGEKNTVFIALEGGRFEPRAVTLGHYAADDQVQVLTGLAEGERVVLSGQFMLDSESQLREAIHKMTRPGTTPGIKSGSPSAVVGAHTHDHNATLTYICPMPEHVAIKYNRPRPCPICGMALVPVSEAHLARIPPGGQLLHYTCPMPEHAHLHLPKPGKCPECSMTLIPVMKAPKPVPILRPLYTCPMKKHAHVVSDKPGKCEECEMKRVDTRTVKHGRIAEEFWRRKQAAKKPAPTPKPELQPK